MIEFIQQHPLSWTFLVAAVACFLTCLACLLAIGLCMVAAKPQDIKPVIAANDDLHKKDAA